MLVECHPGFPGIALDKESKIANMRENFLANVLSDLRAACYVDLLMQSFEKSFHNFESKSFSWKFRSARKTHNIGI